MYLDFLETSSTNDQVSTNESNCIIESHDTWSHVLTSHAGHIRNTTYRHGTSTISS